MKAGLGVAFAALTLAAALPAQADWSFSSDKATLTLADDDFGLMFLSFECQNAILTAEYSTLDGDQEALPADASVILDVVVDNGKRVSFPVVADDKQGSSYGLGNRDAPALWSLLATKGAPFAADLRVGKSIAWQAHFDHAGYEALKDQLAKFCPEPKRQ